MGRVSISACCDHFQLTAILPPGGQRWHQSRKPSQLQSTEKGDPFGAITSFARKSRQLRRCPGIAVIRRNISSVLGSNQCAFVYRIGDRQRFIRIGETPRWSLDVARTRVQELRSIVDQGGDPARENRGREIPPVENLIQYIAENLMPKP
jgi:hypothetical protein